MLGVRARLALAIAIVCIAHGLADGSEVYGAKDGNEPDSYANLEWSERLGRHAWFYLHSMSVTYPAFPKDEDKAAARMLMASIGQLFPSKKARHQLQAVLADPELGPIAVDSREELSKWMCKLHNIVNKQKGKEEFSCEQHRLDLMYLKSCSECTEKFEDGKTHEAMIPWSARLYARDATEYQKIKSERAMKHKDEVEELLDLAVAYNVLQHNKADKFRQQIKSGEMKSGDLAQNLHVLLRPIFNLKAQIKKLERQIRGVDFVKAGEKAMKEEEEAEKRKKEKEKAEKEEAGKPEL